MRAVLIALASVAVAFAAPVSDGGNVLATQYSLAVDLAPLTTATQFTCLKNAGASVAFIRAYKPDGQGSFDTNSITNINTAYSVGMGTEIYMTPQPVSSKWGYDQADELYKAMKKAGITIRTVWVQVTNPVNWPNNTINNCGFINEVLTRSRQNGLSVGLYTNHYDWQQITGGWMQAGSDVALWYWNVNGAGPTGETQPNFNDFAPFASFNSATVKQYGQSEQMCTMTVNKDAFVKGSSNKQLSVEEASKGPVVGTIWNVY